MHNQVEITRDSGFSENILKKSQVIDKSKKKKCSKNPKNSVKT